jgi:hypothetical protein
MEKKHSQTDRSHAETKGGSWLALIVVLFLAGFQRAGAFEDPVFNPDFSKGQFSSKEWIVYSHTPESMKLDVKPVDGQPFEYAASVELIESFPSQFEGKATYFRSKAIPVGSDSFSVEWFDLITDGIHGPYFELWGNVGNDPNDYSKLMLLLRRRSASIEIEKGYLVDVEPGWRHFKIVVSATNRTYDLYYENMDEPVAAGLPLMESVQDTDRIGVGFIWYPTRGTPPTEWQIGGIRVTPVY